MPSLFVIDPKMKLVDNVEPFANMEKQWGLKQVLHLTFITTIQKEQTKITRTIPIDQKKKKKKQESVIKIIMGVTMSNNNRNNINHKIY